MEGTSFKITPINVGSGDAILVQLHSVHGDEYYLIDGGPKKYLSNIERCLEYNNLIKMPRWPWVKPVLQCSIIVTHPDQDHVNGIIALMRKYYIAGEIILTEAFDKKCSREHRNFLEEFFSELMLTHSLQSRASYYYFSPTGIIHCESPTEYCLCYVPYDAVQYHSTAIPVGPFHTTRRGSSSDREWNKSSILTMVGCAAVLTGDSYCDLTLSRRGLYGEHIPIFQVPHHGSKKNIHTDKEGTLERCTELYSKFLADVYVISGSDKIHPHAEVLSGILKAVYQQMVLTGTLGSSEEEIHVVRVVLTGTRGLSAEKIIKSRHMPTGRDYQIFLQRNMEIFHADDIGISCKHQPVPQPFITITDKCKVLHGIRWTPETYFEEQSKIVCQCREHNMDVFGWTTSPNQDTHEIDRFYGMCLLKVPFHEEPWQDARNDRDQQYVYIVAASLEFANYRQVLYLKEIKSAHSQLYEMFAYSDLRWTRKYVPRIFQLRRSTIFCYRPIGIAYHYRYIHQRLNAYIDQLYYYP